VQDLARVAIRQAAQQLKQEQLDVARAHYVAAVVHVLLEVALQVLEHERERLARVDDVVEGDDVGVLELLEQGGLADRGARRALLMLQPDLLERHVRVVDATLALVHGGVRALAQLLQLHVRLDLAVAELGHGGASAVPAQRLQGAQRARASRAARQRWVIAI